MKKLIGLITAAFLLAAPAFAAPSGEFPLQVLVLLGDAKFTKILSELRAKQVAVNKKSRAADRLLPNPYVASYQIRGSESAGEVTFHLAMNSRMRPAQGIKIGMVRAKYKFLRRGPGATQLQFVPVKHQRLPASQKMIF